MVSHIRNIDRSDSIACALARAIPIQVTNAKGTVFFFSGIYWQHWITLFQTYVLYIYISYLYDINSTIYIYIYIVSYISYIYIYIFFVSLRNKPEAVARNRPVCIYIHASATRDLTIVFLSHINSFLSIYLSSLHFPRLNREKT